MAGFALAQDKFVGVIDLKYGVWIYGFLMLLASLYLQLHATAQSPQPQQQNVMSTYIITYTATDRYTDTVPGMEFCTLSQIVNICTS